MTMNAIVDNDAAERIGEFLDQYVRLPDGNSKIPRNIPYFKESITFLLDSGIYSIPEAIKKACLKEQDQMIPYFLFELPKKNS